MILLTNDNREVELSVTMHDHDDIEVLSAEYTDNGEQVEDTELDDLLLKHESKIFQEAYENAVMSAEMRYEGDR